MNAAIPERRPATEGISGLIEPVTFHNDDSGFCVLRVKARGQRDETTVVGSLPSVTAGECLSAEGWWVRDKEHGQPWLQASFSPLAVSLFSSFGEFLRNCFLGRVL
jgi:exodeoxyribonuclease V alpha subunit